MEIINRPVCICGSPMRLVLYRGYYDQFRYWACYSCNIQNEMYKYKVDEKVQGEFG